MHVGWVFAAMIATFATATYAARWPLPIGLIDGTLPTSLIVWGVCEHPGRQHPGL